MLSNLDSALEYAKRGWAVMPTHNINEDGKCACGAPTDHWIGSEVKHAMGKHPYPENGHRDASKEVSQILLWFSIYPNANVSIRTGKESNLVVLDIDAKNGGPRSLELLERQYGKLPTTPKVFSGGGGFHLYFEHPGRELRGRRGMRPGIDVMADGGRIVAPPSNHKSGWRYRWDPEASPDNTRIAPLPLWLLRMIQTKNTPVRRKLKLADLWG